MNEGAGRNSLRCGCVCVCVAWRREVVVVVVQVGEYQLSSAQRCTASPAPRRGRRVVFNTAPPRCWQSTWPQHPHVNSPSSEPSALATPETCSSCSSPLHPACARRTACLVATVRPLMDHSIPRMNSRALDVRDSPNKLHQQGRADARLVREGHRLCQDLNHAEDDHVFFFVAGGSKMCEV